MGVKIKEFGEVQPQCNDCGICLCWSIDESEYLEFKEFWDNWTCRDCNENYEGAYSKFKAQIKNIKVSENDIKIIQLKAQIDILENTNSDDYWIIQVEELRNELKKIE